MSDRISEVLQNAAEAAGQEAELWQARADIAEGDGDPTRAKKCKARAVRATEFRQKIQSLALEAQKS